MKRWLGIVVATLALAACGSTPQASGGQAVASGESPAPQLCAAATEAYATFTERRDGALKVIVYPWGEPT